jgi:hypothetical protein
VGSSLWASWQLMLQNREISLGKLHLLAPHRLTASLADLD